jgi:hypothetical protein
MAGDVIRIGNVEIVSFSETELSFPVADAWPGVSAEQWQANRQDLGDDGTGTPTSGALRCDREGAPSW